MSDALEQASLIMVPTGYENGTLGSLKPLDGSGDFTFTRGSDISATRVNADGYIEKGYENLLTYSNDFLNPTWGKFQSSVTGGQSGYDGTNDAWLLTANASSNTAINQSITLSSVVTLSVYAKANTADFILIRLDRSVNTYAFIDLTDGSVGNKIGAPISVDTESVGNGWYRCSITAAGTLNAYIYVCDANGSVNVTNGDSIYIQDAMLNQGMVSYPYVETTTAPVAGGILEDMPRLDYTDSSCPALLLEPQRTNLTIYSEYFETSDWFKSNATITSNDSTSPEGLNNASLLVVTNVGQPRIEDLGEVSTTYSVSIFVKKSIGDYFGFGWFQGDIGNNYTRFNISTGTWDARLGSAFSDEDVVDYGNGWYRISAKLVTSSSTTKSGIKFVAMRSTDFSNGNIGDEYSIYGAQVEQDATFPTSYIPTYGTSQTRLVDNVNRLDISSLAATYQTLFIEASVFLVSTTQYKFSINDATGSRTNRFTILINNDDLILLVNSQGSAQPSITQSDYISANTTYKIAAVVRDGSYALFANGTKIGEQVGTTPSNLNSLTFGDAGNPLNQNWEGSVNQALIFPTALSDDECIALTTIS